METETKVQKKRTAQKRKVKPIYVSAPPSAAEIEREQRKAAEAKEAAEKKKSAKGKKGKTAKGTKSKASKAAAPKERKKRAANPAFQMFDKMVRDNLERAITVYEQIKKSNKPVTRNGHLIKEDGDILPAQLAYRLFLAGLVNMETVDAEGNPAEANRAFRNKTLDRIYSAMKPANKEVEQMLYGLRG